jgi:hypothetical protein
MAFSGYLLKLYASDKFVHGHLLCHHLLAIEYDIFEKHTLYSMIFIVSNEFHAGMISDYVGFPVCTILKSGEGSINGSRNRRYVPEGNIPDISPLFGFGPPGLSDPAGDEPASFFNSYVLKNNIADHRVITMVNAERGFATNIMDNITVFEKYLAYIFPHFGSDTQRMRQFVPHYAFTGMYIPYFPPAFK